MGTEVIKAATSWSIRPEPDAIIPSVPFSVTWSMDGMSKAGLYFVTLNSVLNKTEFPQVLNDLGQQALGTVSSEFHLDVPTENSVRREEG